MRSEGRVTHRRPRSWQPTRRTAALGPRGTEREAITRPEASPWSTSTRGAPSSRSSGSRPPEARAAGTRASGSLPRRRDGPRSPAGGGARPGHREATWRGPKGMTSVPKSHFERHWPEAKLLISRVAGSGPGAAGWNSSPNSVPRGPLGPLGFFGEPFGPSVIAAPALLARHAARPV